MKLLSAVAGLLLLPGCINFSDSEAAFCDNATPEHRAVACADRLGPEPTGLSIMGLPTSLTAGTCSGGIRAQSIDDLGNKAVVRAETTVGLSAAPPGGVEFYSDATCSVPGSTVTLTAGASEAVFAFKSNTVGTLQVSASAQGWADGVGSLQIARGNGNGLAFLTPTQTVISGTCSGAVTIQSQKSDGSPIQFSTDTQVGLTGDATTGLTFFSTAGCSGSPITVLTINAGQSTATFYFKMTFAGTLILTATANGLLNATQTETVNGGPPAKLTFTTAAQSLTAGSCSGVMSVQSQDTYGNAAKVQSLTTLSLATSAGVTFYSDGACVSGTTQAIIQSNSSTTAFYFKGTSAGSVTVSVSTTGMTAASQVETIRAGTPTKLRFISAPSALTAGACSSAAVVQSVDAYDNVSSVSGNVTIALSASSPSNVTFYSDWSCGTATGITTIFAGQNSGNFYFKDTLAGVVTVTAAASPGFSPGLTSVTIGAASPARIRFTSAAQTIPHGVVSGQVAFVFQDAYGNDGAAVTNATSVMVTINYANTYYYRYLFCTSTSSASCVSNYSSCCTTCCVGAYCCGNYVNVAFGQSSGVFYFYAQDPGTVLLGIYVTLPGGNVSATQSETIT